LYVYLKDKGNNVIINDNSIINNTGYGIKCDSYSSYSKIDSIDMRNNTVKNSGDDGVCIENTMDVSISDLTIENAGTGGLYVYCQKLTMNPPFSIKNISGYGISASGSDFSLNNATIMDCEKDAVYFSSGKSLTLRDSVLENCGGGLIYGDHALYLVAKGNATIERNIIKNNNGSGLYVYLKDKGNNVIINDNSIINNTGYGIKCDSYSSYSKIDSIDMRNNTVKNSGDDGVYILRAEYFTLFDNAIVSNEGHGISLHSSDSSLIFHNNLVNNNPNAYDSNSASNDWHHPILLEGNYWSDYTGIDDGSGTGKHDIVGDGIGDMDISHPDANYDYYPFVNESCWAWPKLNTIQIHTDKKFYGLNKPVTISCIVQNDTGVNISVDTIIAEIVKPDNLTEWITLFEGSTGNCEGTFTNTSLFGIYNITIYAYKVGYLVYNNSKLCFEVLPDHDIAVTNINAPSSSETNSTIIVNATISNIGLNNESDVTVDFIVDGVKQDAAIIASLEIRSRTNVSFQWTAPVGRHNILIYSEPVVNETILWNNKLDKLITIADIWVPDNYPTIQQAVDNATAGNMIVIRDGTYPENIYVNKQLTIQSENGSLSTITRAFDVNTNYVNISGFTVRSSQSRKGIYLNGVDHCIISNNTASNNHHGIYLLDSNYNTIINNNACSNHGFGASGRDGTYGGNGRDGYGYGIYLNSSNKNTLVNNNASSNSGIGGKGGNGGGLGHGGDGGYGYGYGIYLKDSNNNALMDNIANSNIGRGGSGGKCRVAINVKGGYAGHGNDGYCYGIYLEDSNNNTLIGNTANKNRGLGGGGGLGNDEYRSNGGNSASGYCYGIYLMSSSNNTLTDNDVSLNDGSGGYGGSGYYGGNGGNGYCYGIRILSSSENTLTNNIANSNTGNGYDGGRGNIDRPGGNTCPGGDSGSGSSYGFYIENSNNSTIAENVANSNNGRGGWGGERVGGSSGGHGHGFYLVYANNNILINNIANLNSGKGGKGGKGGLYGPDGGDGYGSGIYMLSSSHNTLSKNTANSNKGKGGDGADGNYGGDGGDGYGCGIYQKYSSYITYISNIASSNKGYGGSGAYGSFMYGEDGHGYSYNQPQTDTTPPVISNIANTTPTTNSVTITWDTDENSNSLVRYGTVSGTYTNIESGTSMATSHSITLTGLNPETTYYFVVNSTDTNGNSNQSVEYSFITAIPDTTPPSSVTKLHSTIGITYLNWTWTNPSDPDFNHTELYLNDTFLTNIPAPQNYYNATGLLTDTSYELSTRTVDINGNINLTWVNDTASTLLASGTTLNLYIGWNLISLPLMPEDTSITSLLSPINGNYSIVWAYNASDTADHWKKYDPGAPFGNDLTTMEAGKGYWIMMTSNDTLFVTGDVPGSTDIILKAGWNLIGYNSLVGQPIENALASVSGNYSIIWAYDTSDTADHWKKYDPGAPFGNDLANMEVGKGYWIMMTTDDILEI